MLSKRYRVLHFTYTTGPDIFIPERTVFFCWWWWRYDRAGGCESFNSLEEATHFIKKHMKQEVTVIGVKL